MLSRRQRKVLQGLNRREQSEIMSGKIRETENTGYFCRFIGRYVHINLLLNVFVKKTNDGKTAYRHRFQIFTSFSFLFRLFLRGLYGNAFRNQIDSICKSLSVNSISVKMNCHCCRNIKKHHLDNNITFISDVIKTNRIRQLIFNLT